MAQPLQFEINVYHNKYLPGGQRVMDAVISVSATGDASAGPPPAAAQVIMIDCSGSMGGEKITEARQATRVAIDLLRDEVAFAVVAGTNLARMVYPLNQTMVPASSVTRAEARQAVRTLTADGGTAIGTWLELTNELLAERTEEIKHAILLTDGHNEHQTRAELLATLDRCRGRFDCDARGIGKGWSAGTLQDVTDALLGKSDGLPDPGKLTAEFQALTEARMGKAAADITLRVWHPLGARTRFVKQVHPILHDLSDRGVPAGEQQTDYPTGAWGTEDRDYHLSVELPQDFVVGEEVLGAQVFVASGEQIRAHALIPATWTEDAALLTEEANPKVAHYTGQAALNSITQEGLAALRSGDVDKATANLFRAAEMAQKYDRQDTLQVLGKLVEVDWENRTAKLKRRMEQVDVEMAALRSRVTEPWRDDAE
jgi:hypothetical protein